MGFKYLGGLVRRGEGRKRPLILTQQPQQPFLIKIVLFIQVKNKWGDIIQNSCPIESFCITNPPITLSHSLQSMLATQPANGQ